jgi:hypothetical protein
MSQNYGHKTIKESFIARHSPCKDALLKPSTVKLVNASHKRTERKCKDKGMKSNEIQKSRKSKDKKKQTTVDNTFQLTSDKGIKSNGIQKFRKPKDKKKRTKMGNAPQITSKKRTKVGNAPQRTSFVLERAPIWPHVPLPCHQKATEPSKAHQKTSVLRRLSKLNHLEKPNPLSSSTRSNPTPRHSKKPLTQRSRSMSVSAISTVQQDFATSGMPQDTQIVWNNFRQRKVAMWDKGLHDKHAQAFAKVIALYDHIFELDLTSNHITDGGALLLAKGLVENGKRSSKPLKSLYLGDNKLTDTAAYGFCKAFEFAQIDACHLYGNKFSDIAKRALAQHADRANITVTF